MGLDLSLSIANSGLSAISKQFAVISQNVSNANSPDYTNETAALQADNAGSLGLGVQSNATTLTVNTAVQQQVFTQGSTVSYASTTAAALSGIDQVMGTPGAGDDLPSLLANVQNQFTALASDPSNQTQAQAVVGAAQTLTTQINTVSNAIGNARQNAQNDLVTTVSQANTALQQISTLNSQIFALQSDGGQSTADLQNQRATAEQSLSSAIGATFVAQTNGTVLAFTTSGVELPADGSAPLSIARANVGANATYPGGLPGVMLGGTDITSSLNGGQIGADLALRDSTLPTLQAGLDEFSQNLASQFQAQGLTLFTGANGTVPQTASPAQINYVGFAGSITVNPAVVATPTLVRDGTNAVAGSGTGASAFTPNPAGGPSGFTTLISRVLTYAFGSNAQAGVAQPASNTTGLGVNGKLSLPYTSQPTLAGTASAFAGAEAADSAQATATSTAAGTLQTALQSTLSQSAGVNVDQQMSTMVALQNAYTANAKVITTIQTLFGVLEQMV